VRFETPPGHQAQVDFAEFRFPWGKRYALLVALGYSRLLWLKFYPRQTMATVISGREEAFAYFGGVPAEILFDKMKAVIIDDRRAGGGKLLENPEFLRFGAHWRFRIRPTPGRSGRIARGSTERPMRDRTSSSARTCPKRAAQLHRMTGDPTAASAQPNLLRSTS